jgi:hypothetical protein
MLLLLFVPMCVGAGYSIQQSESNGRSQSHKSRTNTSPAKKRNNSPAQTRKELDYIVPSIEADKPFDWSKYKTVEEVKKERELIEREAYASWLIFAFVVAMLLLSVIVAARLSGPDDPKSEQRAPVAAEKIRPPRTPILTRDDVDEFMNIVKKCGMFFCRWISSFWYKTKKIVSTPLSSLTILNLFTLVFYAFVVVFVSKAILFITFLVVLAIANGWSFNF